VPTASVWLDTTNVTSGGGTYLNWSSTDAAHVYVIGYGDWQAASGRVWVAPGSSTTYTVRVWNSLGYQGTDVATTLNVYPVSSSTLSLDSTAITAGQGTYIRWNASNVTRVYIAGVVDTAAASGAAWVAPGSTTGYTVRTWNALGVEGSGASVTLNVYAAATVSVWVDSSNITSGGGTYLNWSSTGASYVNIANYGNGQGTSGRVWVAPSGTTTYTGVAYNPPGSASGGSAATVTVWAAPSISSFYASPSTINSGQGTTLYPTFSAPGGSASISGIGGVGSGGGYGTGALTTTTGYTLTVTNGAGASTTANATVTVNSAPGPSLVAFSDSSYQSMQCDDAMASGSYLSAVDYYLHVMGVWDSAVLIAPNGNRWNYGANAGSSDQANFNYMSTYEGYTGYCASSIPPTTYTHGQGTYTLTATRNSQQATWYFVTQ